MAWISSFVAKALGGAAQGIGYVTGFVQDIYYTIINAVAAIFIYLLAKCIDLLCWLLDQLPALPITPEMEAGLMDVIMIAASLNDFFPVVEAFYMFGFVVGFISIFICIKLLLKIIPWAIG